MIDTGAARRALELSLRSTDARLVLVSRNDLDIVLRHFDARDNRCFGSPAIRVVEGCHGSIWIEDSEHQVMRLRIMARRYWQALQGMLGRQAKELFDGEALHGADPMFDMAERLFEVHCIFIVPYRLLRQAIVGLRPTGGSTMHSNGRELEMYVGRWPDGSERGLTRTDVLSLAEGLPS